MKLRAGTSIKTMRIGSIIYIICLGILLILNNGCGGSIDSEAGENTFSPVATLPPDTSSPQAPVPADPKPTPPVGMLTPVPTVVAKPGSLFRDITNKTETENYSVETSVPSLGLSFGLLESSGGSYEMEPIL